MLRQLTQCASYSHYILFSQQKVKYVGFAYFSVDTITGGVISFIKKTSL